MATFDNLTISDTGYLRFPSGTTSQRPSSPSVGTVFVNNDFGYFEVYDGTRWKEAYPTNTMYQNGLQVWYEGSSWNPSFNRWDDLSGKGNHTTNTTGTISVTNNNSGSGANGNFPYIYGNTTSGVSITNGWPSSEYYTFIHVTRYTGTERKRIWQGNSGNWLSGHWGGQAGVYYHQGWFTDPYTDYYGLNWFIAMDQNNFVRSNRGQYSFSSGGDFNPGSVSINNAGSGGCCHTEASDWACAFVAVYDRKLTPFEYAIVENYAYNKFFI